MTIGERIKQRRKELKMSQTELAQKTGYADKSAISKIESGLIELGQSGIVTFSRALEAPVAWLMGWTEEEPEQTISDADKALLEAFHAAPEFVRRMVLYNLGLSQEGEKGGNGKV